MRKGSVQKLIAILLLVVAVVMIVVGAYGVSQRNNDQSAEIISKMRTRVVLNTAGDGVVEAMVAAAKKDTAAAVTARGGTMVELREESAKAEEAVRASMEDGVSLDYDAIDTTRVTAAIEDLTLAVQAYVAQEAADHAAFAAYKLATEGTEAVPEEEIPEELEAMDADVMMDEGDMMDDLPMEEEEPKVDMSDFVATAEMERLQGVVDQQYGVFREALKGVYPVLDDGTINSLQNTITTLLYQQGDKYERAYDRFAPMGTDAVSGEIWKARIIRYGDDLIVIGISLIILAAFLMFYRPLLRALGLPRLIIGMFFLLLCVLAVLYDLSLTALLSNSVVRMGMNSILVLAMVPGIQCGISLNLGLPLGIIGGLLGGLISIELGLAGWPAFLFAILMSLPIALVVGILYGMLLNRLKGSEMAVTTYVGYSVVALMCIAWLVLPFKSPSLRWPLGDGLRVTLTLSGSYKHVLNNFLSFRIGGFFVPTGLLLFMGLCCLLVWFFLRSKTGIAMSAGGNNPRFAEATGISVDRMRIIGTALSTILAAIGILVYNQSYGFMQLYTAPRQMGFIAASAILIGGATTSRAKISHVLIGTFLFQGVLTLGMPVANVLVPSSSISETMRILISNGIILYALTKSGGASRA